MRDMILNIDKKIFAVFIGLFLSNVLLWFYLFSFNSNIFNFDKLNYIFKFGPLFLTIVSVLIFFGFVSSRLPKLVISGNNPSYEFSYLLILGLMGLSMAYFYASINQNINLSPYMSMVNLLAIILLVLIVVSRFKSFKALITNDYTKKDQLICMLIFLILGFLSTEFVMTINEFDANIRIMVVMIAGLFGGPIIGIPTAVFSSSILLVTDGGNAICSVVSTIVCSVLASAIYIWNGRKFLRTLPSAILMFLFIGFDMLMIILIKPAASGFPIVLDIYLPMLFAGIMGIIIFQMIISEIKMDADKGQFDAESEIKKLKASIKEHEKKIKYLEEIEKK